MLHFILFYLYIDASCLLVWKITRALKTWDFSKSLFPVRPSKRDVGNNERDGFEWRFSLSPCFTYDDNPHPKPTFLFFLVLVNSVFHWRIENWHLTKVYLFSDQKFKRYVFVFQYDNNFLVVENRKKHTD